MDSTKQESKVGQNTKDLQDTGTKSEEKTPATPAPQPQRKRIKRPKGKWWIVILLLVAAFIFIAVRWRNRNPQQAVGTEYITVPVARRDIKVSLTGTGTVTPNDSYSLVSRINGDILDAPFEEGDVVNKGDLLFQLDSSDVENNIRQAEDSVRNAEDNVVKARDSLSNTQQSIRNAELNLQSAQRNYDDIIKDRDKIREDIKVTSTATGQITKLYFDVGDTVNVGTVIADVQDSSQMLLTTQFHSTDADEIYPGASATVVMTATGETLFGTVDSVSALETVGAGGTLVREVKVSVYNPGGITETSYATAEVNGIACQNGGSFEYITKKSVTAKASGEIETVLIQEGGYVSEGQVILEIKEPDTYDKQIFNAEISLEQSKLNLQNAYNSAKTASDNVTSAQNSVETAKRNLETARDALDDYSITAPIQGTVIEKNYKAGDTYDSTASNAKALAVIFDLSKLTFVMNVDELDVMNLALGQDVTITADALPGKVFGGFIDKININGTTANGVTTYPVTIEINKSEELLPGMNISAEITIEDAKDVLVVPADAVSRGNMVLKQVEGAEGNPEMGVPAGYERVPVEVGRTDGLMIEIVSGLNEGDVVGYLPVVGTGNMMMFGGPMGAAPAGGGNVTVQRVGG